MPTTPDDEVDIQVDVTPVPASGSYRLLLELGRGGMGRVFLAEAVGMAGFRKLVVIKQLRSSVDPEYLSMFLDEARLAARLNHPNVVQTNEVGCDEAGNYFLAMEYLDGQPLNRIWKRQRGAVNLPFGLFLLSSILDALHYAHQLTDFSGQSLRVVHRDVSPHNIFVTYNGTVKLIDFGIAKTVGSSSQTQEGMYRGKIGYASPEQIAGDPVDCRTDIYAAGVVLWEIITGRPLWDGVSSVETVRRVVLGDLPKLEDIAPAAPPMLRDICRKATSHLRQDRFSSASEMREALERSIDQCNVRLTPAAAGEIVQKLFAEERADLQRRIEAQLRASATLPTLGHQEAISVPRIDPQDGSGSGLARQGSAKQTAAAPPAAPVKQRVALIGALAGILFIGFTLGGLRRPPAASSSATSTITTPPSATIDTPAAPSRPSAGPPSPSVPPQASSLHEAPPTANSITPPTKRPVVKKKPNSSHEATPVDVSVTRDKSAEPSKVDILEEPTVDILEP